jgi:hypothetical protein
MTVYGLMLYMILEDIKRIKFIINQKLLLKTVNKQSILYDRWSYFCKIFNLTETKNIERGKYRKLEAMKMKADWSKDLLYPHPHAYTRTITYIYRFQYFYFRYFFFVFFPSYLMILKMSSWRSCGVWNHGLWLYAIQWSSLN